MSNMSVHGLLFILLLSVPRTLSTDVVAGEYCQDQSLEASCPDDQVILMQSGKYGRVKLGECVKRNLGYLGCAVDVLRQLDTRCSGRRECTVSVMDPGLRQLKPCPQDVSWHLEASYRCIPVHTSSDAACHSQQRVTLTSPSGYLSSTVASTSRVGTTKCPWHILAKPGQKINITAFNFVNHPIGGTSEGEDTGLRPHTENDAVCYQFATVTEGYSKRMLTVCSGEARSKSIYVSASNALTIEFMDRRSAPQQSMQFLLEYRVQGCADLEPKSRLMWVKRTGDDLHVKCNKSGESWYLTCSGDTWRGQLGNCSDGTAAGSAANRDEWKIDRIFGAGSDFPIGILIIVSVGVALGVFLGGTLLIVVALHMKRKRRAKAARAACLDPGYLSSDSCGEKTRCSVPMYDPDNHQDPYSMPPKDCYHHHHLIHSTDTLDHKQLQQEYMPDGRCTTTTTTTSGVGGDNQSPPGTTTHYPPPYGGGGGGGGQPGGGVVGGQNNSRLYESPKVSL